MAARGTDGSSDGNTPRLYALFGHATAGSMTTGDGAVQAAPSDVALVQAIGGERDRMAFQLLFVRYAPRLKAHFAQAGRSGLQAEDLVQEVMLSVWNHA